MSLPFCPGRIDRTQPPDYRFCMGFLGLAALYVLASVALSVGGLFAGLALVRNFS